LQYVSDEVLELYCDGTEPSLSSLLAGFVALLFHFCCIYLLVDGLDELLERQNIIDMLVSLAGMEKLQLLAVSHKELDIETSFQGIFNDISLSNPWVDKDIKIYIQSQIRNDRKFSCWPAALKKDIEVALAKEAKGMYVVTVNRL
jgi:hypothetical protein